MGPVIRLWDIETTHNLVAVFRLFGEDYIPHENIVKERYVVTAAWKDLGEKKVHAVSLLDDKKRFKRDPDDDYHVCATLHNMLSTADVIVAHNGDHYDIKFTEARMLKHGLPPIRSRKRSGGFCSIVTDWTICRSSSAARARNLRPRVCGSRCCWSMMKTPFAQW
jgi:hypothetical protein